MKSTLFLKERNRFKIEDLDHLIFHPGEKIVQTVEALFFLG
jgi:hypothetical protein